MKIGISLYSRTGHTHTVATELLKRLFVVGPMVKPEELKTVKPLQMSDTTAEVVSMPTADGDDALLFACPVRRGTPAPPMRVYLE